jgi:hypothetical protein
MAGTGELPIQKRQEIQEVAKRNEDKQNRLAEALLDLSVSTTTLRYTSVAHGYQNG